MKLALLQIDVAFGDPEANERKVEEFFRNLDASVDVVVLPELWTTGYDLSRLETIADEEGQKAKRFLSDLAERYDVHLVGGSIAKKTSDGVLNTMYVFDNKGSLLKEYSKAHLFKLMNEEKYLIDDTMDGKFELMGEKSAGLICYDIRFPEWVRTQMLEGTTVLYVVAEWPAPRIDHWKTLLKARAIENQCYVVACNRVGADPKNEFGGHSIIYGPWGDVLAEGSEQEEIVYGEIDTSNVEEIRTQIPIFQDRRPELYK
ncbi:carbon-nitrogen family hydrolase [Salimicrobium halophilum]|uniref:Carbon-nitrogen hydrolase n=1 Tax=Salimicrobium halophilum TaxID=86666 RepID=A0A1G8UFC3_9BACI|nr:carbon-nitrogen family hydrolase [Salimicrobium halophilum]SDJ52462.1 Carbon-nitrogen hydrolase [Salimicrobium halophilum]